MKKAISVLVIFLPLLVLISCKKSDTKNCTITVANIAGSYKITSIQYKLTTTSQPVDGMQFFDACQKDDISTFNANGTYNYVDAGVACTPSGSYSSTWSLSGNSLTVDGDTEVISSFDCKTLVFVVTDFDTPGDQATITFTKL